jgi:hypothetical protein
MSFHSLSRRAFRAGCAAGLALLVWVLAFAGARRAGAQLPPAGYALSFNGVNQSASIFLVSTLTDNFTIEAWVNPATTTGGHTIAYNGNTSLNGWGLYQAGTQFQALFGGVVIWGSGVVTPNVWTHVALACSGGTATLYVNGIAAGSAVATPNPATGSLAIGCDPQILSEAFDGQIDEVRVWSVALSATQIRTNRRVAVPDNSPGLFLSFHFNEGIGGTTANATAIGGVAALINSPTWVLSGVPYGPTTTTVTSLADDGSPGTLRYVLGDSLPGDTIALGTTGTLTLSGSPLILDRNLAITGPGAPAYAISGNNASRVFVVQSNVTASISGVTIQNGYAGGGTPGAALTAGGPGAPGGGIQNAGTLSLTNCLLTGSRAGQGGGGYHGTSATDPATDGGVGGPGGGIYSSGGALALYGCTLSANAGGAGGAGGIGPGASGARAGRGGHGGNGGGIYTTDPLVLWNCTFGANAAGNGATGGSLPTILGSTGVAGEGGSGGSGGGIYCSGSASLVSCSLDGNSAGNGGAGGAGATSSGGNGGNGGNGGGIFAAGNPPVLRNTLTAANSAGTAGAAGSGYIAVGIAGAPGSGPDLAGGFSSQGHNLVGQLTGSTGFTINQNADLIGYSGAPVAPALGPLQNNGGPTPTFALLLNSPAINAGDDTLTGTDQRGYARKSGTHVDIGAYEVDLTAFAAPVISGATLGPVTNNPANQFDATAVNASIQPNGLPTTGFIQFGPTPTYGTTTAAVSIGSGNTPVPVSLPLGGLSPGLTWHISVVASNAAGTASGPDLTLNIPTLYWPGDTDGDGVVNQSELDVVLSNYWTHSPWLMMTNTAGLGTTNVQFLLTNSSAWLFTVEGSTNLSSWSPIGFAYPAYEFTDLAATNLPQHFYRLRWP